MKTRIVEGYWICPKCNTRCQGSDQDCNNCGAVRTADVKFHLDKNAPAITDEKELALATSLTVGGNRCLPVKEPTLVGFYDFVGRGFL